jgi:sugar phosphate permease
VAFHLKEGYFCSKLDGISDMPADFNLDRHRWFVFMVFSAVYFFVYFHRVSTSVIAPDLLDAFQTNATALGFMSSMYFYLYSLEQPLVGHLSDVLGARRIIGFWSLVAALGCLVFGMAPTIGWAAAGRALIGFGMGGVYVPAMKAFSQWFLKKDLGATTGCLIAVGNVGAMVATTPLASMASTWGWRGAFFVIGAMTLGLSLLALFFVRDPAKEPEPSLPGHDNISESSPFRVLSSSRFWIFAFIFFGVFGGSMTLQGLWATPFVMSVLHLSRHDASLLNMAIPLGYALGAPFFGLLGDRVFRNRIDLILKLLAVLTGAWLALTFAGDKLGVGGMIAVFAVMGGVSGGLGTSLWATVLQITPQSMLGLVTGLLNPFPLLGGAVMQWWTGAVLDRTGKVNGIYPPEAYRDAFFLCLVAAALCLVICLATRRHLSQSHSFTGLKKL